MNSTDLLPGFPEEPIDGIVILLCDMYAFDMYHYNGSNRFDIVWELIKPRSELLLAINDQTAQRID